MVLEKEIEEDNPEDVEDETESKSGVKEETKLMEVEKEIEDIKDKDVEDDEDETESKSGMKEETKITVVEKEIEAENPKEDITYKDVEMELEMGDDNEDEIEDETENENGVKEETKHDELCRCIEFEWDSCELPTEWRKKI